MQLRFYLDPDSGEPHIYRHRVAEDEAEDVLRRPVEDRIGRDGARVAIGQTRAGRYLRVIYVPDPEPSRYSSSPPSTLGQRPCGRSSADVRRSYE
jgi:hypothetical protein